MQTSTMLKQNCSYAARHLNGTIHTLLHGADILPPNSEAPQCAKCSLLSVQKQQIMTARLKTVKCSVLIGLLFFSATHRKISTSK